MSLIPIVLTPALAAIAVLFGKGLKQVRVIALAGAIIQLLLAILLLYFFKQERALGNSDAMLFSAKFAWFPALNIYCQLGVDGISIVMILLTAVVVLTGILVSWQMPHTSSGTSLSKEFFFQLLLLATGAYGFFISADLFTLFFFLEVAVMPKFLLIGIWGSGQKTYSAIKLALMLMAGSAFIFIGMVGVYFTSTNNSFDMMQLATGTIPLDKQLLFFPFLFVGFGVFGALFPFHTWVPDGHSAAPTAGSMFLAGISMKLGGYGCLRVAAYIMPEAAHHYSNIIILLSTIAIIYGAFATLMQKDLKYINAYSSVSHCGFVLFGIGMLSKTAINGAVMQMVSHGLMTALFFAVIGMMYERTHTRMVSQLGGLLKVMPFICTVFVIAGLCSLGLPGLSGFVAEMTVFVGAWQNPDWTYRIATVLACASIVVTAVYILRAIGSAIMGPVKTNAFFTLKDAGWNEKLATFFLIGGILLIGVFPSLLTNLIDPATEAMMKQAGVMVGIK